MKHQALLFDFDGVIVDTAKYHYLAWKQIAAGLGFDFTEKDNERLKGVSRIESFKILLSVGNITMSEEEQLQYCEQKNKIYVAYISRMTQNEILPGVKEFLFDARKKGYKLALGSASKNSHFILDKLHLLSLFDAIVDGTLVATAKPDPEVYIRGAELLSVPCKECMVFEDAVAGIEAGHAGGMMTVGIGKKNVLTEADV